MGTCLHGSNKKGDDEMTETTRKKLDQLVARFEKCDAFYADPDQPQAKKDAWRPKMEALVDELGAEYERLYALGVVGPDDLPRATAENAKMIFNAREVT